MSDPYALSPEDQDLDARNRTQRPAPMDELQLIAMLRREEADSSSYYSSEIAQAQTDAMDAYNGKLRGDEILPNRSSHVTHDVADTMNWLLPPLMRTFSMGEDFLTIDDDSLPDNASVLQDAQDYLKYVFFRDNSGEKIIHDFAFDGLLQKIGIIRVYWDDPQPEPPYIMEGVTEAQLADLVNDPDYRILEASVDGEEPPEPPQPGEDDEHQVAQELNPQEPEQMPQQGMPPNG